LTDIGDDVGPAARPLNCASTGEGRNGPPDAITESGLPGVDHFRALRVGQPDMIGDQVLEVACLHCLAATQDLQHRDKKAVPGGHFADHMYTVNHDARLAAAPRSVHAANQALRRDRPDDHRLERLVLRPCRTLNLAQRLVRVRDVRPGPMAYEATADERRITRVTSNSPARPTSTDRTTHDTESTLGSASRSI
jgi:hypothetical protein